MLQHKLVLLYLYNINVFPFMEYSRTYKSHFCSRRAYAKPFEKPIFVERGYVRQRYLETRLVTMELEYSRNLYFVMVLLGVW